MTNKTYNVVSLQGVFCRSNLFVKDEIAALLSKLPVSLRLSVARKDKLRILMKYFLSSIPKNILRCFAGYNWVWHVVAMALTFLLVTTDADWYYFVHMHSETLWRVFLPALMLGGLLPMLAPLYLLISGLIAGLKRRTTFAFALGQAAIIGSFISSTYKAFTGRVQPNMRDITHNISHGFNFGFLKHGAFWGWPSSHTTIAFAMAVTLIKLFSGNKLITILCLLYALYIGIGVSFTIHWLAGAIIGAVIGTVVGESYKSKMEQGAENVKI